MKMTLFVNIIKRSNNKIGWNRHHYFKRRDIVRYNWGIILILLQFDYFHFIMAATTWLPGFHSASAANGS